MGAAEGYHQIFCTQTCPFLALKTLSEITWCHEEVTLGSFDFVTAKDMFVPLLV